MGGTSQTTYLKYQGKQIIKTKQKLHRHKTHPQKEENGAPRCGFYPSKFI